MDSIQTGVTAALVAKSTADVAWAVQDGDVDRSGRGMDSLMGYLFERDGNVPTTLSLTLIFELTPGTPDLGSKQ